MHPKVILQTNFPGLKFLKRGKVRDIYEVGEYLLIVSTDRISAFDVIMNQGIPYKGMILTKISEFWFRFVEDIIPNHLITTNVEEFPSECKPYADELRGRSMLVKKTEVIPIESVVRGYITGSGMVDYKATGSICGIKLPEGLVESEKLNEPIFTPATKEELGSHDQNISEDEAKKIVGDEVINFIKEKTIAVYKKAYEDALKKGIIIADTKMEFGKYNGEIILIDELLTPDSSRFWPADKYQKGRVQESFDKQFLRNYLISINFNRQPPAPDLPEEIIMKTSEKYLEALEKLTGQKI
ncbi:MAG: phosphoribosylaminoimidazole-succinocarboxamide synthase [Ignavibacterium sp.]|uniref:phosphoribosylaminoimidazolesuccinocarboxamide synthase n=1 Tax=Ignavibacterium sp. TaxID=2651167 RepID=UPI0021DC056A|nr:phosphoribosylaminoimidazolesuccinocarboxamide synthase [Ignavibacterium sp.]BDQ01641.1 MAG: phosphoribosylaminoimidazole-succinocarboxamide synthase [Ignavibacterium sp.]GIV45249.1 MAG: phosphoribosylaminoimidazole-succinocarboxamide synthase [Ignavibacterium sp.]